MLERLFIADVGQHRLTPGQLGGAATGQKQAGPGHQGGQPQAFQGYGFAAGVGAGDRHHPQGWIDAQAHGHHRGPPFPPLLPHQQRMAQVAQLPVVATQFWFHGPQPGAVAGPGQGKVQLGQTVLQCFEGLGLGPHGATELQQHPPFLLPFLALQLSDAVAQAHHRLGFQEKSAAGG